MHTLAERTYVNRDSTKVVPENSPEAAFLLGQAGDEISDETAARLGLDQSVEIGQMKKPELVAYATGRGLDSSGTADEIRARIAEADEAPAGGTADQGAPEGDAAVGSADETASTSSPA